MRLLILGFGYSAKEYATKVRNDSATLHVTARSSEKIARLRAQGRDAIRFDGVSTSEDLNKVLHSATHVLISIPPDEVGDPVLRVLRERLHAAPQLERVLYLSTVGVYGDHGGVWVDETTPLKPTSQRSIQRVAAEREWQDFAAQKGCDLGIFRLSGIYGPGRSAIDNLRAGTARRIIKPGQVFNRIHVFDIAGALENAMRHSGPLGVFNLTDDEPCPPQDVVLHAAAQLGVEPPPEIDFEAANLSAMARSFYGENKRVSNAKIKVALGYRFVCPTYREGLRACL